MKFILYILLGLLLLGSILFFLGYGIQNTEVISIIPIDIQAVTTDSITVTLEKTINNPSRLSVPIQLIQFTLYLDSERIGNGLIQPFILSTGETTVQVTQRFSVEDVSGIPLNQQFTVNGTLHVIGFSIPFEETFTHDITPLKDVPTEVLDDVPDDMANDDTVLDVLP